MKIYIVIKRTGCQSCDQDKGLEGFAFLSNGDAVRFSNAASYGADTVRYFHGVSFEVVEIEIECEDEAERQRVRSRFNHEGVCVASDKWADAAWLAAA